MALIAAMFRDSSSLDLESGAAGSVLSSASACRLVWIMVGMPERHSSAFGDGRADCAERYARATVDDVAASCGRDGNQTV
ncbi:hypothetical protein GA0070560_105329 [Micromonospora halophytica]|uniref:Uncharacterized protein n=1 Tax=Micromonospora halophytica TaxID=47864 RepID=A0A1C5HSI9_9ACTN|nr:hypothetical protein GA0070560_105329 [Micromonospora halophytica]